MKIDTLLVALDKCKLDIISYIQYSKKEKKDFLQKKLKLTEKLLNKLNKKDLNKNQKDILDALKKENEVLIMHYKDALQKAKLTGLYITLYNNRFK